MVVKPTGIEALPNELLIHVLTNFSTRTLLRSASVSHRFHDMILRILHHRILAAASLQDHKLIFECYHPSARLTSPGILCDYLGTDSLSEDIEGKGELYKDMERTGRLGKLAGLYSHFRPVGPDQERRPRRRPHPAGDIPSHPDLSITNPSSLLNEEIEVPSQIVSLESHELFSQLCANANLVKVGPKRGLLFSCVTIGEGVIRVWRNWLAEHAVVPPSKLSIKETLIDTLSDESAPAKDQKRMLWLDREGNVGIRLRVIEREDFGTPILLRRDEDAPVSYSVEYEELVIRTTQLLLKVEESLLQEANHSGKAIVIGSFEPVN